MTNQETKDFFQKELECFKPFREQYKSAKQLCEAFENAINALEQQPSDDCVSRKAVIEYIKGSDAELGHDSENEIVIEDILNMPPVTPTQKSNPTYLDCQKCENFRNPDYFKCKNCGKGGNNNAIH